MIEYNISLGKMTVVSVGPRPIPVSFLSTCERHGWV